MAKPDFFLEIIDKAIGETPIKRILEYFYEAVEKDEQPDPRIMKFLAVAFREINDGVLPNKALNLETGRGRKRNLMTMQPKYDLAVNVLKKMEEGKTYENAIETVCSESGKSFKTIQRYYGDCKRMIATMRRLEKLAEDNK